MPVTSVGYLDAVLFAIGGLTAYFILSKRSQYPLPLGPKPKLIQGNLKDMPQSSEWITFTSWRKQYGEVVYVRVFSTPIIILNTFRVASLLLDKRAKVYSGRPHFPMAIDLIGFDWGITMLQNTPWHRYERRMFEGQLRPSLIDRYAPKQKRTTVLLLQELYETPEHFMEHLRHAVGSTILDIIYGYRTKGTADERIELADHVARDFSASVQPGAWVVDAIPILRYIPEWMPGVHFKKKAREFRERMLRLVNEPYAIIKDDLAKGVAKPSVAVNLIEENRNNDPKYEQSAKEVTASAYAAGTDTTTFTLRSFIMQMMLHPTVQKLAQAELDAVCPDRLPEFDDRPSLIRLECIFRETLRFHPALPQCIPHRLDDDDVFEGQRLPKGAVVIPNIWGMLHDDALYDDPDTYRPDRFMKDGKINPDVQDPRDMFFGFGKRQCPGRGLAEAEIYLVMASILKAFKIEYPLDGEGKPYVPETKYDSGVLSGPHPFPCRIVPRSPLSVELIRDALDHI